jgi:hypothetical protein
LYLKYAYKLILLDQSSATRGDRLHDLDEALAVEARHDAWKAVQKEERRKTGGGGGGGGGRQTQGQEEEEESHAKAEQDKR